MTRSQPLDARFSAMAAPMPDKLSVDSLEDEEEEN